MYINTRFKETEKLVAFGNTGSVENIKKETIFESV